MGNHKVAFRMLKYKSEINTVQSSTKKFIEANHKVQLFTYKANAITINKRLQI